MTDQEKLERDARLWRGLMACDRIVGPRKVGDLTSINITLYSTHPGGCDRRDSLEQTESRSVLEVFADNSARLKGIA